MTAKDSGKTTQDQKEQRSQLDPYLTCQRCQQPITAETRVWIEMDSRTGDYTMESIPEEHSQGCFPFGPDCAKHPNKPYKVPR